MTEKLAGSELLQMAVQLEKEGKEFYLAVAESVKNPVAREIFQFLADEEVKHEEIFRSMLSKGEDIMLALPYDDYEMLLYFKSLVDKKIFPGVSEVKDMRKYINDPAAALRVAISFEKDAILFFSEFKNLVRKDDQNVIDDIIEEERKHIYRILEFQKKLGE
ncbi:ferritin family protein [bacterium]|nr:ferritin family protein [bacterium]